MILSQAPEGQLPFSIISEQISDHELCKYLFKLIDKNHSEIFIFLDTNFIQYIHKQRKKQEKVFENYKFSQQFFKNKNQIQQLVLIYKHNFSYKHISHSYDQNNYNFKKLKLLSEFLTKKEVQGLHNSLKYFYEKKPINISHRALKDLIQDQYLVSNIKYIINFHYIKNNYGGLSDKNQINYFRSLVKKDKDLMFQVIKKNNPKSLKYFEPLMKHNNRPEYLFFIINTLLTLFFSFVLSKYL